MRKTKHCVYLLFLHILFTQLYRCIGQGKVICRKNLYNIYQIVKRFMKTFEEMHFRASHWLLSVTRSNYILVISKNDKKRDKKAIPNVFYMKTGQNSVLRSSPKLDRHLDTARARSLTRSIYARSCAKCYRFHYIKRFSLSRVNAFSFSTDNGLTFQKVNGGYLQRSMGQFINRFLQE